MPLLIPPAFGFAQEACAAKDDMVLLADYVLANRSKLAKLQNRRNGAISAYLKITYQGLNPEQVEGLLEPLAGAKVDRAPELLLSWRIANYGLEEALAKTGPDGERDLLESGFSPLRAAIRSGEIPYFFDRIAALPEGRRRALELRVVQSVIDIDEDSKKALGAEAMSRKLYPMAAAFAASEDDPKAWPDFLAALSESDRAAVNVGSLQWFRAVRGKPKLPGKATDAQSELAATLMHETMIASARIPEREYLSAYLNITGDFAGAGRAAAAIIDLTREGGMIDMETAWLVIYEALVESSGDRAKTNEMLKTVPAEGTRFGGENVRQVLDHMLAVEALKRHAANGGASRPPDLEGASAGFDEQYKLWQDAAVVIAAGGDLAGLRSSGQKLSIAANLLFASGRHKDLAKFLTSTVPNADSIRLAEIFAEALDRQCNGYLAFPGEAVLMPGTPMFKFEPQT